jgi:glycosyltransferase involved in cell wall biosynthesis
MNIGYDISILEDGRLTGVEKVARFLYDGMWQRYPEARHVLFCRKRPDCLRELPEHVCLREVPGGRWWRYRELPKAIRQEKLDVFLSPVMALPGPCGTPVVPYIHECQWRHAAGEAGFWRHRLSLWLAAARCKLLLTNSEFTRQDIMNELGRWCPETAVISPAGDPELSVKIVSGEDLSPLSALGLPDRPYALFVSTIRPKKNIGLLLEAFARPELREMTLVCAGRIDCPDYVDQARKRQLDNVIFPGYVDNATVRQLYRRADCFLYLSKNEGFGLPLLEAFALDCPVIASRHGAIPEVAGDAALYLDDLTPEKLAKALIQLQDDEAVRKRLVAKGRLRLGYYSWGNSADKLYKILSERFGGNPCFKKMIAEP